MKIPIPLSYGEQVELFKSRGMTVTNIENAKRMLNQLGYYRFKEVARPLSRVIDGEINYEGTNFDQVVSRYYQDKNLRVYLLHCIEEVEVSFKTNIAYVLGRLGPFEYLKFPSWYNRDEYCKYYLSDRQKDFKKRLRSKISNSSNPEITKPTNLNPEKFPSIWLAVDVLTFGDAIHLVDLMSNNNQKRLADFYGCTPTELISWLKCLKFVRNVCAHNSNIIDIKLHTTPIIHNDWKQILYKFDKANSKYTNRIAVVLCVLKQLMKSVNPGYNYSKIYAPINTIASSEILALQLGFSSSKSIDQLFPKKNIKKHRKYKDKHKKSL